MAEPEVRLLRAPKWRWREDGNVDFWHEPYERWQGLKPWTAPVLEALTSGCDYAGAAASVEGKKVSERALRQFLFNLHEYGYIEIRAGHPPAVYEGRFERVRELGRGGIGVADLCLDLKDGGRKVVVKRGWDFLQPTERTEASMHREAETLGTFEHAGIPRLVATFTHDGHLHLVKEFVEGDDLLKFRYTGVEDATAFRSIVEGVADVVGHIHERNHLLLDLRPANFFLDATTGNVRLIDVGLCQPMVDGRAAFEMAIGSPGFVSPEMMRAREATIRSDVFGFGRLVSFLATGQFPKRDESTDDIVARIADPVRAAAVAAMCAEDPAARPASMHAAAGLFFVNSV